MRRGPLAASVRLGFTDCFIVPWCKGKTLRKRLVALLFIFGAGAALFVWLWPFADPRGAGGQQAGAAPPAARKVPAPDPRFATIPARAPIGDARGDAFAPRQWTPEAPSVSAQQAAAPPAPPPMPYRYAGKVVQEGAEQVLLAKGDVVLPVRVGETLEGGYRVESISAEWISLRYLPLGTQQRIPVTSMLDLEGQR